MLPRKSTICRAPEGIDRGTPDDEVGVPQQADTAQVAVASTAGSAAATALDTWFASHCCNSPISQRTDVYARIFQSVAQIKDALSQI